MLLHFFVVTASDKAVSVYHIRSGFKKDENRVVAEKIALRGESSVLVGNSLTSVMVAISSYIIFYSPEKRGERLYRNPFQIDIANWLRFSAPIVALFQNKDTAMTCFATEHPHPADLRWQKDTMSVLASVGRDHPWIEICCEEEHSLIPRPSSAMIR